MGQVSGDESGSVEIVTDKQDDRPLVTEQVPKQWYNRVLRARDGQQRLSERYSAKEWYHSVDRTTGDMMIGGLAAHELEIGVTSREEAPDDLPEEINEIPVTVAEREPIQNDCSTTCSCVKGGSNIGDGLTLCCSVEDSTYGYGILTCAHGFGDCGDNIHGTDVYVCPNGNTNYIGEVKKFGWNLDWAFVDTSNARISGLDNKVISSNYEVKGHVTKDGVDYMISNGETVHKYGQTTCHTKGAAENIRDRDNCNNGSEDPFVSSKGDADQGDSGGPHYREHHNYGYTTIVGVHKWSAGGFKYASAAYKLHNNHGISFSINNTC